MRREFLRVNRAEVLTQDAQSHGGKGDCFSVHQKTIQSVVIQGHLNWPVSHGFQMWSHDDVRNHRFSCVGRRCDHARAGGTLVIAEKDRFAGAETIGAIADIWTVDVAVGGSSVRKGIQKGTSTKKSFGAILDDQEFF